MRVKGTSKIKILYNWCGMKYFDNLRSFLAILNVWRSGSKNSSDLSLSMLPTCDNMVKITGEHLCTIEEQPPSKLMKHF